MAKKVKYHARAVSTYTSLHSSVNNAHTDYVDRKVDASTRMFGMPHQMLESCDARLRTGSDLGRMYAETFVAEAPTICIKPGIVRFLPGMSGSEKNTWISAMLHGLSNTDSGSSAIQQLLSQGSDPIQYYDHKGKFGAYMKAVNMLCQEMSILLGVGDVRVPWCNSAVKFKNYRWQNYRLGKITGYNDETDEDDEDSGFAQLLMDMAGETAEQIEKDDQYIRFYVDASASFSESLSNTTGQSMLESFTSTLEGYAKEASMIFGTAGLSSDYQDITNKMASSIDNFVTSNADQNTGLATILKRLGSGAQQIIQGGNFQIPEIYNDSDYSKSYSFSMTLSTPYGSKLAWYINIGVPLCFLLGLACPLQLSANTYKSPFLLKAFSQGWFNCSLGIVDSLSIDKGGDQSWSIYGLPNEIKVSLSIKDLYSALTVPATTADFLQNSGMLEFLMATCGLDITNQNISNKYKVWLNLFKNSLSNYVSSTGYDIIAGFREAISEKFLIFK